MAAARSSRRPAPRSQNYVGSPASGTVTRLWPAGPRNRPSTGRRQLCLNTRSWSSPRILFAAFRLTTTRSCSNRTSRNRQVDQSVGCLDIVGIVFIAHALTGTSRVTNLLLPVDCDQADIVMAPSGLIASPSAASPRHGTFVIGKNGSFTIQPSPRWLVSPCGLYCTLKPRIAVCNYQGKNISDLAPRKSVGRRERISGSGARRQTLFQVPSATGHATPQAARSAAWPGESGKSRQMMPLNRGAER